MTAAKTPSLADFLFKNETFILDPPSELKDRLPKTIETGETNFNADGAIMNPNFPRVFRGEAASGQEKILGGFEASYTTRTVGRPHPTGGGNYKNIKSVRTL